MTGLNWSSFDGRAGYFLRGSGQAEASALSTVRHPTPYLRCSASTDSPARASRRMAA